MALKAGRVGVAPDQVDEFGRISSEATSGYTKQEADAKFETQTHAASTYETKSDAAALQPIMLSVPIEMLSGTKLTVEEALNGLNADKADKAVWTPEVKVDEGDYGAVYFSENLTDHLACLRLDGSVTGSSTTVDETVDLTSYAGERPITDSIIVPIKGSVDGALSARWANSKVITRIQIPANIAYARGFLLYPTKATN